MRLFILIFLLIASPLYAATITIEVSDLQLDLLTQYAEDNNVTVEAYSGDIVGGWANQHIEGYYIEQLRKTKKEDLEGLYGKIKIKESAK